MRLSIHPGVFSDIDQIMAYYERVATPKVADDFYGELRRSIMQARQRPASFPVSLQDRRRMNLKRFPYHFLFRIAGDDLRILVVRHHRRHPSFGIERR